ncbi:uncharacterized protein BDZ99DRAFT_70007 [Mytilinidion resinicola]|uniref:DUF6594 domain-containing protein n=1 Tax=Mytilinidion resinicola TaxID=574789 RepID=A0A6A6YJ35_9PEZI|nr:uncharacterized protein BDZ99DRAFT_70007 [Mytilinidion resinicola]KAF2807965.1 hypothetical protein BDZ99DRAFT_70007 [Mytilinidion resinicola]
MTERRASTEGFPGLNRSQISALQAPRTLPSGLSTSTASNSTTPVPRRRSLKSNFRPEEPAHPASLIGPDVDNAEPHKNKQGRYTPRKTSREASPRKSTSPRPSTSESESREKDIAGYLPKLSRILEGKENVQQRRQKSSSAGIKDTAIPRRSRAVEDDSVVARRAARQKQSILQRRADTISNLANPSMLSLVSDLTNTSNTSSGSNSTVTQKSYDRSSISKRRLSKERRRIETKTASATPNTMDASSGEPSVFKYMQANVTSAQPQASDDRPTSSSSSSSASTVLSDNDDDGVDSSNADEPEIESPMTSPPMSSRKLVHDEGVHRERFRSDSGISVRDSSPDSAEHAHNTHQPSVHDLEEEEEEDEEEETEDDEESDGDGSDEEGHDASHTTALQRVPPPVAPATSPSERHRAGSHDRHHRRLKDREEELRQHVLQSPQPHSNFQFFGDPSPHPRPALPLIDPHAHYDAASVSMYPQAPQVPPWSSPAAQPSSVAYYPPPQAPYPPSQAHVDNAYAMSPGGSNSMLVPPPPFHYGQAPHYPTGPDLTKTTLVGYELLADKLSERPKDDASEATRVTPMYRKFENLNHRVLLHVQDEISELEEELRYLDECIAQMTPPGEEGHIMPASRRVEARYGGELHYRRTDCLGRIYMKLGQYNQALSSYSTMMKELDPASADDIQAYHSWMERHAPVDKAESRFLEHRNDLLAIARRRRSSAGVVGGAGPVESAALGLPLMLVLLILPLMAFAVIPGLLGRLFIIVLIGLGQAAVVTQTDLVGIMAIREWAKCGSM